MSELFDASMDYIMGLSPVRQIKTADYTIDNEQRNFLVHCYRQLGSKNKAQLVPVFYLLFVLILFPAVH